MVKTHVLRAIHSHGRRLAMKHSKVHRTEPERLLWRQLQGATAKSRRRLTPKEEYGDLLEEMDANAAARLAIRKYMRTRFLFHKEERITAASVMQTLTKAGYDVLTVQQNWTQLVYEKIISGNIFVNWLLTEHEEAWVQAQKARGEVGEGILLLYYSSTGLGKNQ